MKEVTLNKVAIIGGTGTLGKALLKEISARFPNAFVTVISRDEHKQAALSRQFPKARFVIGDVRDRSTIAPLIQGQDAVFHVAAMKHVDLIEKNVEECVKTNILGTLNVARAAMSGNVKHVIYSSTDKAVDPINAYGYAKAIGEKALYDFNTKQNKTKFSVYRWGNVLGSNGSVIPWFVQTLLKEQRVYITHPDMTRFWLPIEWAVNYMLRTFPDASLDRAMIPPVLKAASIAELASAVAAIIGVSNYEVSITGIRPGEKLHEVMHSQHSDEILASNTAERFTRDELMDLIRPIVLNAIPQKAA